MNASITVLGSDGDPIRTFAVGALVAARIAPLTVVVPWITLPGTSALYRAIISLVLVLVLTPLALVNAPQLSISIPVFSAHIAREVLVGLVFAIASALPLLALSWAGQLIDIWRGATMAEVLASSTSERPSALGTLYLLLAIVLFVSLDGIRLTISAFADGFVTNPVGSWSTASGMSAVAFGSLRLFSQALSFSALVATPIAVAIVLTEITFAMLFRALPHFPLFFATMPLRAALGLGLALLTLSFSVSELPQIFAESIQTAVRLIRELRQVP